MTDTEANFVRGRGTYVADLVLPRMLHLKIARSIYARARLVHVKAPLTGHEVTADLAAVGEGAEGGTGQVPYPVLARDRVNYVGQPIAAVLGESEARAEDLLGGVDIGYEPLKPIVNPEEALRREPIHPGTTTNVFAPARTGRSFKDPSTPIVLEDTLENERIVPNPLEPRGVVVDWDGHRLTVYASTQSVISFQDGFREALGLTPGAVRVVQMDTGGAFGSKGGIYPEYVVAAHAAMQSGRPVRWIETRSEHLQATEQGRGARARMKVFADRAGRVQGLRADVVVDGGAYSAGMGAFAPGWISYQITGPYAIPKVFVDARAVYTNKVPSGPYRGAGRPEAAFFIERMMDLLADELGRDPVDVRLQNASGRPWTSPTGLRIPAFKPFLQAAVRELGYRKRSRFRGTGFSSFVLIPAANPGESGRIAVEDGRVRVWLGGSAHGQGHEVFVRRLVAEELRVPPDSIVLERSDTDALAKGIGSWGSRSAMVGGGAVIEAARKLKDQVRKAHGRYSAKDLLAGSFDARTFFKPQGNYNSFGANLVTAEVEETGRVWVRECLAYYDVGRALNPAMVDGQVAGGSLQGIGQVLYERVKYDAEGQVLTGSLMDAGLATVEEMAERISLKTPKSASDLPHGAKGVGESPAIGVPPALVRAIERAVGKRLRRTPIRLEELARVPQREAEKTFKGGSAAKTSGDPPSEALAKR
ncbi:MAG TPA: xanthine dehydrogenase family protein molybdopterin-binding subunit [Thermoplasmata archaeon]|nr:xanthine dehydrogenase family protein molybdopterin-binding subunit [Thermoplasmata archaeon]